MGAPHPPPMTLIEQLLVVALMAILSAMAVISGSALLDAIALRTAMSAAVDQFFVARMEAIDRQRATAVRLDAPGGRLVVHAGTDTIARLVLAPRGIGLWSSRDSMAYGPDGLGFGAANLTLVLTRGARRDTLTVSRLGRVAE